MHAPLAGKLDHLFVVLPEDHLEGTLRQLLPRLYHHRLLDKEAKTSNNGLIVELTVTEDLGNHEADGVMITLLLLARFDGRDST